MTIRSLLDQGSPVLSFEYFPPKTEQGEQNLFERIQSMKSLEPGFVSITCGAGGSTRHRTIDWAERIKHEIGLEVVAHMTCLGLTREQLADEIAQLKEHKIENVLALRGDPPKDAPDFSIPDGSCHYAIDLVRIVAESYPEACVLGACYPEVHVDAASREADLRHLKEKCDAGIDVLVTQLFLDNKHYFDFVSETRAAGIDQPIVPGIMPMTAASQVDRFTQMHTSVPQELLAKLEECGEDKQAALAVGVRHATDQCRELLDKGAPGIHFYTLNQSPATSMIVEALR